MYKLLSNNLHRKKQCECNNFQPQVNYQLGVEASILWFQPCGYITSRWLLYDRVNKDLQHALAWSIIEESGGEKNRWRIFFYDKEMNGLFSQITCQRHESQKKHCCSTPRHYVGINLENFAHVTNYINIIKFLFKTWVNHALNNSWRCHSKIVYVLLFIYWFNF